MGRFSLVGVILVLFSSSGVSAEIDRSEFPDSLRAMEWREVVVKRSAGADIDHDG